MDEAGTGVGGSRPFLADWLPVDVSRDGKNRAFDEQGEEGGHTYTVAERDMQGSPPVPLGEDLAG